jgi:hypothetical protein
MVNVSSRSVGIAVSLSGNAAVDIRDCALTGKIFCTVCIFWIAVSLPGNAAVDIRDCALTGKVFCTGQLLTERSSLV